MAQIREFTVEGLAGRREPFSARLNPDVNVFYGLNGSGKTTLLKILHSSLSTDTDILADLPFLRAEVVVYLNRYETTFTRTITQSAQKGLAPSGEVPGQAPLFPTTTSDRSDVAAEDEEEPTRPTLEWSSNPPEPDGYPLTTYAGGFLPISRLYRNISSIRGRRLSDQELDNAFARGLQDKWSQYYADVSLAITKVQGGGFAKILGLFFVGAEQQEVQSSAAQEKDAYKRIDDFLRRQGFDHLLPDEKDFAKIYAKKSELRSVVKQIEDVEKQIEVISAPRERFRTVLESMFSGSKRLVVTEKEIQVQLQSDKKISLSLLSSGEKQLLFIALHALVGRNHCLMVDEPELSMHVDWQKKLVATLRDLNPRLQLIMATHSPEIMADLLDNQIFR